MFMFLFAAVVPPAVMVDAENRSVSFTAVSTDCGMDAQLEFLFVGPKSDRDYEAMFVTDAGIPELAAAFEKAGIPLGSPADVKASRFWPCGNALEMKPSFKELVREMRGEKTPAIIYTGGTRDAKGAPEAATNMPGAVFALYGCGQSLLTLNDVLDQSATYGRFQPAVKIPKGERRTFTFTWNGERGWEPFTLKLEPRKLTSALLALKKKSALTELNVTTDFSSDLTIKEATNFASALALIDSVRVKLNGATKGQFFFRAFLPMEKWRDRKERLAQPPEVHLKADGSITVTEILEDWSETDSLDPKLTAKDYPCADLETAAKLIFRLGERTSTAFIFAPPDMKLAPLFDLKKAMKGEIVNWYIFSE